MHSPLVFQTFSSLPAEILTHILQFAISDFRTLLSLSCTSSQLRRLIRDSRSPLAQTVQDILADTLPTFRISGRLRHDEIDCPFESVGVFVNCLRLCQREKNLHIVLWRIRAFLSLCENELVPIRMFLGSVVLVLYLGGFVEFLSDAGNVAIVGVLLVFVSWWIWVLFGVIVALADRYGRRWILGRRRCSRSPVARSLDGNIQNSVAEMTGELVSLTLVSLSVCFLGLPVVGFQDSVPNSRWNQWAVLRIGAAVLRYAAASGLTVMVFLAAWQAMADLAGEARRKFLEHCTQACCAYYPDYCAFVDHVCGCIVAVYAAYVIVVLVAQGLTDYRILDSSKLFWICLPFLISTTFLGFLFLLMSAAADISKEDLAVVTLVGSWIGFCVALETSALLCFAPLYALGFFASVMMFSRKQSVRRRLSWDQLCHYPNLQLDPDFSVEARLVSGRFSFSLSVVN